MSKEDKRFLIIMSIMAMLNFFLSAYTSGGAFNYTVGCFCSIIIIKYLLYNIED